MSTLQALHDKVVLKKIEERDKIVGGIIIPDTAKERSNFFEVIDVGKGMYDPNSGNYYPVHVKVGDTVVVPKAVLTQVLLDDEEFYVCREVEILSIVID